MVKHKLSEQYLYIRIQDSLAQRMISEAELLNVGCKMEKLKPEKVVEILRKRGMDISVEQGAQMLELLRKFANIIVFQHLESQKHDAMRKAI